MSGTRDMKLLNFDSGKLNLQNFCTKYLFSAKSASLLWRIFKIIQNLYCKIYWNLCNDFTIIFVYVHLRSENWISNFWIFLFARKCRIWRHTNLVCKKDYPNTCDLKMINYIEQHILKIDVSIWRYFRQISDISPTQKKPYFLQIYTKYCHDILNFA